VRAAACVCDMPSVAASDTSADMKSTFVPRAPVAQKCLCTPYTCRQTYVQTHLGRCTCADSGHRRRARRRRRRRQSRARRLRACRRRAARRPCRAGSQSPTTCRRRTGAAAPAARRRPPRASCSRRRSTRPRRHRRGWRPARARAPQRGWCRAPLSCARAPRSARVGPSGAQVPAEIAE
jgi:hypothetical protein